MGDQSFDKESINNGQSDNMAQENEQMEDAIDRELNVDDSVPGTQHLDDAVAEEDELGKCQEALAESKDKYLRLVAEFENFRRRNARERMELIQTASKDVVHSLLVVLDDMDRAQKQMETSEDVDTIKEGVSLVFNKLRNILQQKGLKKMESIRNSFDPELHEAITDIPAPDPSLKEKVIDEVEPGYYLNDKLIRYAKVIVGK